MQPPPFWSKFTRTFFNSLKKNLLTYATYHIKFTAAKKRNTETISEKVNLNKLYILTSNGYTLKGWIPTNHEDTKIDEVLSYVFSSARFTFCFYMDFVCFSHFICYCSLSKYHNITSVGQLQQ